jgi:hypothetical protein
MMNQTIWNQAGIVFLGCCQEIPVIEDPDPMFGHKGDIAMGNTRMPSSEMDHAFQSCAAKWAQKPGHFSDGPVVIIARDVTGLRGSYVEDLGITNPANSSHAPLCQFPRALTPADVVGRYSIVTEQARFGPRGDQRNVGNLVAVLAHEMGHQLLLSHGNGIDDDGNGTMPPNPGPRLFDSECDPAESGSTEASVGAGSLMGAQFGSTSLTPLQVELARDAAKAWPGHVGP